MNQFEEEILIKDSTGRFKILKGGRLYDLEEKAPGPALPAFSKIVEFIIRESGLEIKEPFKKRLEEIVEAFLKDVRDKLETKSMLMQPVKVGGMGLGAGKANLIIKLINRAKTKPEEVVAAPPKAPAPPVVPSADISPPAAPPKAPPAAPPTITPTITPGVAEFVFSPEDEKEIVSHKQKLSMVLKGLESIEIARFVSEIIRESGIKLDPENQKKLENIILIHLKDIRDGYETQETLLQAAEPTGLKLTPEQTEKILRIAKSKFQALESKLKEQVEGRIKKTVSAEEIKRKKEWQKAEAEVKKKIDIRWEEITKKPKESTPVKIGSELLSPPLPSRPKTPRPTAPQTPTIVQTAEGAPLAPPPPKVLPPRLIGPIPEVKKPAPPEVLPPPPALPSKKAPRVPETPRAAAVPKAAPKIVPPSKELREIPPAVPSEEPKPLEIFKPEKKSAPVVRRPPGIETKKPRIEDIKVVPRLVGPVEELRELSLIDFRRLDPNPRQAIGKVQGKINLLEKESFTKKIQGIRAWQESEVNKLYLEIAKESVEKSKTIGEILNERAGLGKPVLTEEEFKAVMDLNKALRF